MVGGLDVKWKPGDEEAQLNELGASGWELVTVILRPSPNGEPCVYYYLRRETAQENPRVERAGTGERRNPVE